MGIRDHLGETSEPPSPFDFVELEQVGDGPTGGVDAGPDPAAPRAGADQRRWLIGLGALVAAVAIVGFLLGPSEPAEPDAAAPNATTTTVSAAEASSAPVTTPGTATTSGSATPESPTGAAVGSAPDQTVPEDHAPTDPSAVTLADAPIDLGGARIYVATEDSIVAIDGAGEVVGLRPLDPDNQTQLIDVVDDHLLVRDDNDGAFTLPTDDLTATPQSLGTSLAVAAVTDDPAGVVFFDRSFSDDQRIVLLATDGTELDAIETEVPALLTLGYVDGSFIYSTFGATLAQSSDGSIRTIRDSFVPVASNGTLIGVTCGDDLVCRTEVVDIASGERLGLGPPLDDQFQGASLSDDRRSLVISSFDAGRASIEVHDLEAGRALDPPTGGGIGTSELHWSPTGWLVTLRGNPGGWEIALWNRDTGDVRVHPIAGQPESGLVVG